MAASSVAFVLAESLSLPPVQCSIFFFASEGGGGPFCIRTPCAFVCISAWWRFCVGVKRQCAHPRLSLSPSLSLPLLPRDFIPAANRRNWREGGGKGGAHAPAVPANVLSTDEESLPVKKQEQSGWRCARASPSLRLSCAFSVKQDPLMRKEVLPVSILFHLCCGTALSCYRAALRLPSFHTVQHLSWTSRSACTVP